ncbi:MAG: T9SS type A sorting domain-containing protein [Calditrichaeota bacterium]|nr:T9SS type A sorting domain-containing protein [Calditrichota bacterium]MCB9369959.1 T9SS type A sorting domain-containing protein [Calditrichota bacterium]
MKVLLFFLLPACVFAEPWVVGCSGAPGTQSCASSCHGEGGGTVEVHNFPESYVPDSTYIIQLTSTGLPIKNFNASCRIGTSSLTGGVILPHTNTATYSVDNEPNGVHAIAFDQDTLEFRWRAPNPGTGNVTLYVAAHQGHDTGPNTDLQISAEELFIPQPPDTPSHPSPADQAEMVSVLSSLHWDEVDRAESFNVYFGQSSPPPLVSTQTQISYAPDTLFYETTYFWRIEAVNDVGTTAGPEWSFSTEAASAAAVPVAREFSLTPPFPNPFNGSTRLSFDINGELPLTLQVFDLQGRLVETLFDGVSHSGLNTFVWQASGASGVYFLRTRIAGTPLTQKVLFLK